MALEIRELPAPLERYGFRPLTHTVILRRDGRFMMTALSDDPTGDDELLASLEERLGELLEEQVPLDRADA